MIQVKHDSITTTYQLSPLAPGNAHLDGGSLGIAPSTDGGQQVPDMCVST